MSAILETKHLGEKIFFLSLTSLIVLLSADYKYLFLPINGIWLLLYVLIIAFVTIWGTFVAVQKLLQQNMPLDVDTLQNNYPVLRYVYKFVSCKEETVKLEQELSLAMQKTIDERIEALANDIEDRFICKWYDNITKDDMFKVETKQLLEMVIRRFLQVVVQVDSRKIAIGTLSIMLKHLKEYRKTLKRVEKNGGNVEGAYRYSHVASKSPKALEHFLHKLTGNLVQEFISWELCNSLPCKFLVSILAKKVTRYFLIFAAAPGHLNHKVLSICAPENSNRLKLDECSFISLSDIDHSDNVEQPAPQPEKPAKKTEQKIENLTEGNTPKISPKKRLHKPKPNAQTDNVDSSSSSSSSTTINSSKLHTTSTQPIDINPSNSGFNVKFNSNGEPYKARERDVVKIYEPRPTSKTWRNSSDLECISLGQDLLALQDPQAAGAMDIPISSFMEHKLWRDTDSVDSDKSNQHYQMWDITESWAGEDDSNQQDEHKKTKGVSPSGSVHGLALKSITTTNAANLITNTVGNVTASTLHNMKELQQSTVNNVVKPVSQATTNAMNKIGDLQDEAAGVMEGILDFGMAGIRKGLRLTGLQDVHTDIHSKPKPPQTEQNAPRTTATKPIAKLVKVGHVTSEDAKTIAGPTEKPTSTTIPHASTTDPDDSVWMNPLGSKESPGSFDGHILLETSSTSTATTTSTLPVSYSTEFNKIKESVNEMLRPNIPQISTECDDADESARLANDADSPEYEEAADLESTINKLRSLLQQRSSESSLNTPALSPMPLDDPKLMCTTPVDLVEATKADGTMNSVYKICAKTATGVFNTVKNVLPGGVTEQVNAMHEKWLFVEDEVKPNDLMSLMDQLLVERRDFCTVDTAYEAMDSVDLLTESASSQQSWAVDPLNVDDETDNEFENTVPITKALVDMVCECLAETDTALIREPLVKSLLILGANNSETCIEKEMRKFLRQVNKYIGELPKNQQDTVIGIKLTEMVDAIVDELPGAPKQIIGESNMKNALTFLIGSLQSQLINQDILVQVFELISAQIIVASSLMSPTPSA